MTKPLTSACTAVLLSACGGRELEAETNGGTGTSSSGGATDGASLSDSVSVTVSTTITTEPSDTTADPTTPTTDPATGDLESSGAPETTGGSESCCEPHANPGCEEEAVATCVCEASPECCVFEWAPNCVELAMGDCAATCMGPGESSGGESSTGAMGGACDDVVQLEYLAEDAVLDGWELVESAFPGEGTVAGVILDMGPPGGTVTWDIDIPCDDDWHIWVRGRNAGQNDSYFARQDGGPDPAPIFELDCEGGDDYAWRELNWRDPENGGPCEYVQDPWLGAWEAGVHQFQLEYRESRGVARIIVTNDDAFVPM